MSEPIKDLATTAKPCSYECSLASHLSKSFENGKIGANREGGIEMKYVCQVCGYIYDPEVGDPDSNVAPGTPFENIPDDWVCPVCGASKDMFAPVS